MSMRTLLAAGLFGLVTPFTFAHGVWIAERVDTPTIVYGHGAGDESYDPKKITFYQAFDENGQAQDVALKQNDKNADFSGDDAFSSVAVVMDNGYWSKRKDGSWVNEPKNAVKDAVSASHSVKTALGIVEHGRLPDVAALAQVPLLIVPLSDVLHAKKGDKIDVVVYFQGQPLADAKLIGDYVGDSETVVATTDAQGKASVPVRNQGLNVLAVSHKVDPPAGEQEKADKVSYTATLSFVNEHHEH